MNGQMQAQQKPTSRDRVHFPDNLIPSRRAAIAFSNGVQRQFAINLWGGIGDQICAEPTLRWAKKNFNKCEFVLATPYPEIFKHLGFKRIYNLNHEQPIWEKHLKFETISPQVGPECLPWYFYSHGTVNAVDYCTMHAFRWELTNADKQIKLTAESPFGLLLDEINSAGEKWVCVHPGKHWPSKTFPKDWWDAQIEALRNIGITPIIVGAESDKNRGTVNVNTTGCIDMRDKLTLPQSIWLLQNCQALVTNDSSPLHMAASGDAWIACMATCKHWDFISHWRHGEWQWREKNFSKGNMYYLNPNLPTIEEGVEFGELDEKTLREWLPAPNEIADWLKGRIWI